MGSEPKGDESIVRNARFLGSFSNPVSVKTMSETVEEKVRRAIEEIRPKLQADGGDIGLLGVENGIVKVKLKGACAGCPMSAMTIQWGVERYLKSRIPEVESVEAV